MLLISHVFVQPNSRVVSKSSFIYPCIFILFPPPLPSVECGLLVLHTCCVKPFVRWVKSSGSIKAMQNVSLTVFFPYHFVCVCLSLSSPMASAPNRKVFLNHVEREIEKETKRVGQIGKVLFVCLLLVWVFFICKHTVYTYPLLTQMFSRGKQKNRSPIWANIGEM